jgi:hypothetical protein
LAVTILILKAQDSKRFRVERDHELWVNKIGRCRLTRYPARNAKEEIKPWIYRPISRSGHYTAVGQVMLDQDFVRGLSGRRKSEGAARHRHRRPQAGIVKPPWW